MNACLQTPCVRHSPGGLPCTGRSFPLLLDSSFPALRVQINPGGCPVPVAYFPSTFAALRHVSGMLPVGLAQGGCPDVKRK